MADLASACHTLSCFEARSIERKADATDGLFVSKLIGKTGRSLVRPSDATLRHAIGKADEEEED